MSLTSRCSLIGGGVPIVAAVLLLAARGRSFTDVLTAGVSLVLPTLLLNLRFPPWGFIAFLAFVALSCLFLIVAGLGRRSGLL